MNSPLILGQCRTSHLLAKNIALRNPKITQRELNFAVQQTIDRIIFLRICEDRGIELYGRLQALQNGENIYERLKTLFHQADLARGNFGLHDEMLNSFCKPIRLTGSRPG